MHLRPTQEPQKGRSVSLVEHHIGLDPDEQVILLVRKHWVVFRNSLVFAFFVPFVLAFLAFFLNNYPVPLAQSAVNLLTEGILLVAFIILAVGMLIFAWHYYMWTRTFYVMTSKKLGIINHHSPWNYQVQQINLSNVNDVTLKQEGIEAFLYGYANVVAITISGSTFTFSQVKNASEVQKAIMQQLALQKHNPLSSQVDSI
jgi:hypothetical protein